MTLYHTEKLGVCLNAKSDYVGVKHPFLGV